MDTVPASTLSRSSTPNHSASVRAWLQRHREGLARFRLEGQALDAGVRQHVGGSRSSRDPHEAPHRANRIPVGPAGPSPIANPACAVRSASERAHDVRLRRNLASGAWRTTSTLAAVQGAARCCRPNREEDVRRPGVPDRFGGSLMAVAASGQGGLLVRRPRRTPTTCSLLSTGVRPTWRWAAAEDAGLAARMTKPSARSVSWRSARPFGAGYATPPAKR